MRRCLDEGDVSALHSGAIPWVPDLVKLALLALAAHLLFPVRGVELSGVLDVHEGSDSDDAKVQEVGFLAEKHLEWRLPLERLLRSPILEVRGRPEQLLPHGRWEALSASMYRTMVHRVPPTHSNTPRFCGVLVATKSLIMPVSKQYCRKSSPVYSPPMEATEDHAFVFVNK